MRYTLEFQTGWAQTKYGKKPEWRAFTNVDDKKVALKAAKKNPWGARVRVYDTKLKKTIATFGDFVESKQFQFRQMIRELIDDEIEEMTTSGAAGSFNTPFAFQGDSEQNKKKRKSTATQAGFTLSDESGEDEDNEIFEGTGPSWTGNYEITDKDLPNGKVKVKIVNKRTGKVEVDRVYDDEGEAEYDIKKYMYEAGDPYYAWRNDEETTPRQKIGHAIAEVNKALNEMNKTLKQCGRLKKEAGMATSDYWKRTNGALLKIEGRIHKVAQRVRQMRM